MFWNERIARERAGSVARRLLQDQDGLHPEEWNQRFGFIQAVVEAEIQEYARQVEAQHRRLHPLGNGQVAGPGR